MLMTARFEPEACAISAALALAALRPGEASAPTQ
jgi:hypothetical protein